MPLSVYTDGSAQPNPGHGGLGVAVFVDGALARGTGTYLGAATTNNVAEWRGVIAGLKCARQHASADNPTATLYCDSELVVKQLSGKYRVKEPTLVPLHREAKELLAGGSIRVVHVRRHRNTLADALANRAVQARGPVRLESRIVDAAVGVKRART